MYSNEKLTVIYPVNGFIDLSEKKRPICELQQPYEKPLVVRRGICDVSKIKQKLLEPSTKLWEEEYHNTANVHLVRPAHDNWGIKKIIFHFCDDFMTKILDLPWSQDEEWKALLSPIYESIHVSEHQIIRALFASMPTNSIIPVHHDTGYWVKHSHRIHVAIDTSDEVDFLVGATNETLQKVIFSEGHIIELNNQAKHAVTNHMLRPRIHFIFDFIEPETCPVYPILRYTLSPGDIINQTRRSIDLAIDYGKRPIPSFIIIGAQKSGTTSLYELICQHSLAIKGKRRESHYFDWYWDTKISLPSSIDSMSQVHEDYREYYDKHFTNYRTFYPIESLLQHPSLFTGESTPSYLLHSDIVIPRMKAMIPWIKLFVILRNPVDRAYSQYQMSIDPNGNPEQLKIRGQSQYIGKTFHEVVEEEIQTLKRLEITAESTYETLKSKYLTSSCTIKHGGHSLLVRGLYDLQLQPWLEVFPIAEKLMILDINDIKGTKEEIQKTMDKVFSFLDVPIDDIQDIDAKNTRTYNAMDPAIRKVLEKFYEPFNKKLYERLGRNFGW